MQPEQDWKARPWILAVALALCGLCVHFALDGPENYGPAQDPLRQAIAAFFFFGGLATTFSIERLRWLWSVVFGAVAGLTLAGVTYWVAQYDPSGRFDWNWAFGSGLFALALATPLFQTFRDQGRAELPYDKLHFHAWTDVVIFFAGIAFTGLAWLLLNLLAALFDLIGLDFLTLLTREDWFNWMFVGAAFGSALGLLRENEKILGTLQNIFLIILSVLAPAMALGLAVFLIALLFTGLDNLWDATQATTPILLTCAIWAVILANAIIRNSDEQASSSRILRISAMVLGATILPLGIIAAVSIGLRIDQHGWSPNRMWGALVTAIAVAYGLAYLISLIKKRMDWAATIRPVNVKLSIGLCAIALFLALPILDFGAISTRDQIARLSSGEVSAANFDWGALKFDFGPSGRAALLKLSKTGSKAEKSFAISALEKENKWDFRDQGRTRINEQKLQDQRKEFDANLRIIPEDKELRIELLNDIRTLNLCKKQCVAVKLPNGKVRIVHNGYNRIMASDFPPKEPQTNIIAEKTERDKISPSSKIEVRAVENYDIYVDGKKITEGF